MDELNAKESKQKYSVVFSMRKIDISLLERDSIQIYPSDDKFNNFGFRTFCHYFISTSSGLELTGILHLAFLGEEPRPYKVITSALEDSKVSFVDQSKLPTFFSMFPTMQDYRDAVSKQGPKTAREILLSLNDLVALNHVGKLPTSIEAATNTDVFKLSFLRKSETFFTFHNAGSILDGLTSEVIGEVSLDINLNFKLDGFSNAHQLKFKFDPKGILPKRICVVIGKNGVGKSQALGTLARFAITADKSLTDASGGRPLISRLVAIGTPGEGRVTFPPERRGTSNIYYRRLLLSRSNGKDGWRGLGELLVQLARSEDSIKGQSRWEIFCDSLSNVIPLDEIAIPLREGSDLSRWGKVYQHGISSLIKFEDLRRRGEQASLETWGAIHPKSDPLRLINGKGYSLSSGQLAFFRFAAQACLYIENGTLLLLDEPETHLHPNLITDFIGLLDKLLEFTGSIAIIATHSAYFVREVPRSQVLILRENENRAIEVISPRLKTFGADVGSISFFVFGDDITNRLFQTISKNLPTDPVQRASKLDYFASELSAEAMMEIQRSIPLES